MSALGLAALALAAAPVLAACGSGGGGEARDGGSITIALSAQPDYLDPALSYTSDGWSAMWLVYTPLLTYRRAEGSEGTKLVPGLAEAMPEISADGRTYRLRLRPGLRYSDGRPVRAGDFEHTIKRVLSLESGGASFFEGIDGAADYLEAGKPEADIGGIEADERTREVTIRLEEPDGTFQNVLAMNFAGLVPRDTPFENLTRRPPPGAGPYRIARSAPNRDFVMERNRRFEVPGIPGGRIDRITARIVPSAERATQDVMSGRLDYMQDPPPPDLLREVRSRHRDRFREFTTVSTYFFFLNSREAPFERREVREAVNFALDERALSRIFGGLLEPTCNFLPPGMIGHRPLDPCPWGDPNRPPDVGRARDLIERSGARGAGVTVWGDDEPEGRRSAEYLADVLNRIGMRAKPRIVDGGVYFATVGNRRTRAQAGFASFSQDFPHPANFMALVDGEAIQPTNNINFGNVDDPELNAGIDALRREPHLERVAGRWAELDRKLVERAWLAPFGHRRLTTFMSERMDFERCSLVHPVYGNDFSSFCLR